MARVDYERMAAGYDAGRDYPPDRRLAWRDALATHVDPTRPVLDLGAGTGQWAGLLAGWFSVDVVAVEPSTAMRSAGRNRADPRVRWLAGQAERLPLADGTVGMVWLSAVWHHLSDPGVAAAALARVLRPGGVVCLRGAFPDAGALQELSVLRAFPEAAEVLATFPTLAQLTATLTAAGFRHVETVGVTEPGALSTAEVHQRAAARADTLLRLLPDPVYQRRLAALASAASAEAAPRPWPARLPLVVFTR